MCLNASSLTDADRVAGAVAPHTQQGRILGRLAFLAPTIQHRLLRGSHRNALTLTDLTEAKIPLAWVDQESWFEQLSSGAKPLCRLASYSN